MVLSRWLLIIKRKLDAYLSCTYFGIVQRVTSTLCFKVDLRLGIFFYSWLCAKVTLCSWPYAPCYLVIVSFYVKLVLVIPSLIESVGTLLGWLLKAPFLLKSITFPEIIVYQHYHFFTLLSWHWLQCVALLRSF